MKSTDIPVKFPIPWANSAGAGYVRTVPQASQIGITNGAASLTDGYPPLTFLPTASGGVPPFGQDTNGILKQVTQWLRWAEAGAPVAWDSSFSSSIGGYPNGAIVASATTPQLWWLSTTDDNTTNPDSGGAGWTPWMSGMASRSAAIVSNTTLKVADAGVYFNLAANVVATLPSPASSTGLPFGFFQATGNGTVATPSGNIFGGKISATSISIPSDSWVWVQSDGNNYRIVSAYPGLVLQYGVSVYNAPGTYNFTYPGAPFVDVIVTGGGGSGGGCQASSSSETFSGAGGGAGATLIKRVTGFAPGTVVAVVVGAGGASVSGGNAGNSGGASSFGFGAFSAPGGIGGGRTTPTSTPGGPGGVASGGDTNVNGGYGSDGQDLAYLIGGHGGASFWGGGGRAGNGGGLPGQAPGSGGGGAYDAGFTNAAFSGGAGAPGIVRISW